MTPEELRPMVSDIFARSHVSEAREWAFAEVLGVNQITPPAPSVTPQKPRKITDAIIKTVLRCHEDGMTRCAAQRRAGISRRQIITLSEQLGIRFPVRTPDFIVQAEFRRMEREIRRHLKNGTNRTDAAVAMGVGHMRFNRACQFLGIDYPRLRSSGGRHLAKEIIDKLKAFLRDHPDMPDTRIAQECGVHRHTVQKYRRGIQ